MGSKEKMVLLSKSTALPAASETSKFNVDPLYRIIVSFKSAKKFSYSPN